MTVLESDEQTGRHVTMGLNDESRWEYEVVSLSGQLADAVVKAALNDLGGKGWELVGAHLGAAECPRYVFKRRVAGQAPLGLALGPDEADGLDAGQERTLRNASIAEALMALPAEKRDALLTAVLTEDERHRPAPPDDFYERVMLYFTEMGDT